MITTNHHTLADNLIPISKPKRANKTNFEDEEVQNLKKEQEQLNEQLFGETNTMIASRILNGTKQHKEFLEDNQQQTTLYYSAISFYIAANDSINQRVLCYVPLEIISINAYVNLYYSILFSTRYILSKFNTEFSSDENISGLFDKLPKEIKKDLTKCCRIEFCTLKNLDLKNLDGYAENLHEVFKEVQLLFPFARKLRLVVQNMHQNIFYW